MRTTDPDRRWALARALHARPIAGLPRRGRAILDGFRVRMN